MTTTPTPAERGLPEPAAVLERTWRATWFVGEDKLDHGIEKQAVYTANQMREMYQRGLAARPLPSDWVADGWKLVPVEATDAQLDAASDAGVEASRHDRSPYPAEIYAAMVAAAPAAPSAPAEGGDVPGANDAMHWIDRYASGIDEVCQLDRIAEALGKTAPEPLAQGEAIGEVVEGFSDAMGHAPSIAKWYGKEPAPGTKLYASPQPAAEVARLMEVIADAESGMTALFESGDYGMCDDAIEQGFAILADIRAAVPGIRDYVPPNPPQPSASVGGRQPTAADVIDSLKKLASMRPKPGDPPQVERMFEAACVFFFLAYAEYIESALTTAAAGGG